MRLDVYELSRSPNGKSESTNVYKSVSDHHDYQRVSE